jgi:chromosome segregation ATPase
MTVERLPPPLPQSGAGPGRPPVASTAEQLEATKLYLRRAITSTHELSATNDRLRAQLAERDKQLSSHEARKKLTARQGIDQQQMLQTLNAKLEAKDAQLRELQAKLCQMERAARPRSESERLKTNNHILNLQRQLVRLKGQLSEEFPTREHPFESALNDADRLRTEHERRWRTERVRALDLTRALEEARARIAQLEREHDAAPVATARGREPRPVEPAHGLKLAPAWHDSKLHAPISSPRGEDVGYWIGGIAVPAQPAGRHSPGRSTIQT